MCQCKHCRSNIYADQKYINKNYANEKIFHGKYVDEKHVHLFVSIESMLFIDIRSGLL